jgi:SAM-dependent methyltransferase
MGPGEDDQQAHGRTRDAIGVDVVDEQVAYYRARADVYDESYERDDPEWHAELAEVRSAFDAVPFGGDVLELGAGTGQWTARIAPRVASVTALDAAPEMLRIARDRVGGVGDVTFEVVDLLREWAPDRMWDGLVACFFVEHVPDALLPGLLDRVAAALRPGATVFVADGAHRPADDEVEVRELGGRSWRVVERRRTPEELSDAFGAAGLEPAHDVTPPRRHRHQGDQAGPCRTAEGEGGDHEQHHHAGRHRRPERQRRDRGGRLAEQVVHGGSVPRHCPGEPQVLETPARPLHPPVGGGEWLEAEAGVEAMGVGGRQQEALEALQIGVVDDRLHERLAEPDSTR